MICDEYHDMSWFVNVQLVNPQQSIQLNLIVISFLLHMLVFPLIFPISLSTIWLFAGRKSCYVLFIFVIVGFQVQNIQLCCISWRKWLWRDKSTARIFWRTLLKTTFTCNLVKKSTKLQEFFREVECQKVQMDVFSLFQAKTMRLAVSFLRNSRDISARKGQYRGGLNTHYHKDADDDLV